MDKPLMLFVEDGPETDAILVVETGVTYVYHESTLKLYIYNDGNDNDRSVYCFVGVTAKNLFARLKKLCV